MADRLESIDWQGVEGSLTAQGFAHLPQVLKTTECKELAALYEEPDRFRSRIDMTRFRFGKGEYQYFRYPLPPLVEELRHGLFPRLAPVANRWAGMLGTGTQFPDTLEELLERCREHGQ